MQKFRLSTVASALIARSQSMFLTVAMSDVTHINVRLKYWAIFYTRLLKHKVMSDVNGELPGIK